MLTVAPCSQDNEQVKQQPLPTPTASAPSTKPDATPASTPAVNPAPPPPALPSHVVHRNLLTEAGRAELDVDGLLIDIGTLDQHKYTRGGWNTGWGRNRKVDDLSVASIDDRKALLRIRTPRPIREIVMRARGVTASARVNVSVDGDRVGTGTVASAWGLTRISLSPTVKPGDRMIEIARARRKDRVEVDWFWLSERANASPPASSVRVAPVQMGGREQSSLLAATPRSYSFYISVPADARLAFDVGAASPGEFAVNVESATGQMAELFRTTVRPDAWHAAQVDLAPYAGQTVRLELATLSAESTAAWGRPRIEVPRSPGPPAAPPTAATAATNLILLLADTARADVYAPFSDGDGVGAKRFEAFAAQSTVFRNTYNNENWTKPSIATLFAGIYPGTHNARWRADTVPDEAEFLSEHLARAGFQTAGFVANRSAGAKFGFDQGWDVFEKTEEAEQTFGRAKEWLENRKSGRFYLYIQTIDAHVPYEVERSYTEPFYEGEYNGKLGPSFETAEEIAINDGKLVLNEDDLRWARALYNGEILYHDKHFGIFLDYLRSTGLLDNTVIAVVNDHGEDLGERVRFGHGWTTWEPQYRSPFAIHYPALFPSGAVIKEVVEHVDVAPTLAEALGVGPLPAAEGSSLLPLVRGQPKLPRPFYAVLWARPDTRILRYDRWKLLVDKRGRVTLYDLVADSEERTDVVRKFPVAARMCEVYLGEALAAPNKEQRLNDVVDWRPLEPGKIR